MSAKKRPYVLEIRWLFTRTHNNMLTSKMNIVIHEAEHVHLVSHIPNYESAGFFLSW